MRLHSDRHAERYHDPELLETGRELLRRVTFSKVNQRADHQLAFIVKACLTGREAAPIANEVAGRLRQSIAAYETYAFDNTDVLEELLKVQPDTVLDALFSGGERLQQAGIDVFEHLEGTRGNPANVISCEALLAWCEKDRETRYPLAASIIAFATRPEASAPLDWSEQAIALLANAPSPQHVLAVFVERFSPMSWSGSRAAIIEANARLLDNLEPPISDELVLLVEQAKAQLSTSIEHERERERSRDRARDERFE